MTAFFLFLSSPVILPVTSKLLSVVVDDHGDGWSIQHKMDDRRDLPRANHLLCISCEVSVLEAIDVNVYMNSA